MNSWMKRRITRSRARCQKVLPERKQKERPEQAEEKASKPAQSPPRANLHTAGDK
jgi:hypothetical protein